MNEQKTVNVKRGLEGVVADMTTISKVMPEINSLVYKGYPVQDLAENCTFEEVAFLLWNGELPNEAELAEFKKKERSYRDISGELVNVIKNFPKTAHPMDTIRTGVSFLGMEDERTFDNTEEVNRDKSLKLLAAIPTIIAADYRTRKGLTIIAPKNDLSLSENFFYMCFGEVPNPEIVRAFDVSLILYAEHGFNASTFTSRVIASTTSDMYSAVTGAIGALKGPLHGGGEPTGTLAEAINKAFGSFGKFKDEFTNSAATNFGSGWTWLVKDSSGSLKIVNTDDAGCPLTDGLTPVLTIDVWEHAYYIDYRNARPDYINAFWNLVNWDFAASNL